MIAKFCSSPVKESGGKGTFWWYPCRQKCYTVQKRGGSQWPLITVGGSQWTVKSDYSSKCVVKTGGRNWPNERFEAHRGNGQPEAFKQNGCKAAVRENNSLRQWRTRVRMTDQMTWFGIFLRHMHRCTINVYFNQRFFLVYLSFKLLALGDITSDTLWIHIYI